MVTSSPAPLPPEHQFPDQARHRVRVSTRARRHPGTGGARGHGVPRRLPLGQGRVPRGGRVLRPLGVPDHHAARPRVAARAVHRAGGVLGPPDPPPAPGTAAGHRVRRDLRVRRDAELRAGAAPLRRARRPLLRGQLALHRRGPVVLRPLHVAVAVPAPLVARDRGAVLPGVAARSARMHAARARVSECSLASASPGSWRPSG